MTERNRNKGGRLHLRIIGRCRTQEPTGIRAAPPHLPVDLFRLPGETVQQLAHRALQCAVGEGVVLAVLFYPDEVLH